MTRKQYYHKGMQLVVAINKYHGSDNLGSALAHFKEAHRNAPKNFGSYEKAWNCEAMRWARKFYLGEDC